MGEEVVSGQEPLWVSSTKMILKLVMWLIFIAWAAFLFLLPSQYVNQPLEQVIGASQGTLFGNTGTVFMIFSFPILVIAFLASICLAISSEDGTQLKKSAKGPSFRLWTFPVLVDGPFGVVTAAEMIGIILFSIYIIWALIMYLLQNIDQVSWFHIKDTKGKWAKLLELTGLRFGFIGLICLAFLFLPVARGSVLLRAIDIPFEHATRYHVWLAHVTMALFTLHGLFYVISWTMQGQLVENLVDWKTIGISNFPGVICLAAGLLIWVTSLAGVRRKNFKLFFYTHQLYVVFVVALAMHIGDFYFMIAGAGIFLFMLDRFLRFCQSRRTVDILSATYFPSGIVEIVLSKPANLHYNALGWIFIQIPELSWLQWHPFSISSSPLDGKHHLAILIKVMGNWTKKLKGHILNHADEQPDQMVPLLPQNRKITASVEGPYGHESPYYLKHENLILVAGGIGISSFLAILSDITHRISDRKPCLPRNILIVWAVKKSDELPLLESVDMEAICPRYSDKLNLEIQTFVTQESQPSLEEGETLKAIHPSMSPSLKGRGVSSLAGTGNAVWSGLYVTVSTIGLVITVALVNTFYIKPFNVYIWWCKALLLIGCMVASVVIFGGSVIALWNLWEMRTSSKEDAMRKVDILQQNEASLPSNLGDARSVNTIRYSQRPNFQEIFGSQAKSWGSVDIGVVVCGPPTLQSSVAEECRRQNMQRKGNQAVFHFYSHSFHL